MFQQKLRLVLRYTHVYNEYDYIDAALLLLFYIDKFKMQTRKVIPKRETGSNCNVQFMIIVHV